IDYARSRISCPARRSSDLDHARRYEPMMMFRVGEKVVYPNHGVATVENISSRSFGSQFERFYLLRLMYSTMTVMVPFSHVGNVRSEEHTSELQSRENLVCR